MQAACNCTKRAHPFNFDASSLEAQGSDSSTSEESPPHPNLGPDRPRR
jgi:hypothetical protein